MKKNIKHYLSWRLLVLAVFCWLVWLGLNAIWPMMPGHWNPSVIDGKGTVDASMYLCPSLRRAPVPCSAMQFWGYLLPMSLIGGGFLMMTSVAQHPIQSLLFIVITYGLLIALRELIGPRKRSLPRLSGGVAGFGIVFLVLLLLISAFLFQGTSPSTGSTSGNTQSTSQTTVKPASSHALADALALVPSGVSVFQGGDVSENWYWAVSRKPLDEADNSKLYQLWAINPSTKVVNLIQERKSSYPAVDFSADAYAGFFGYKEIRMKQGWEGSSEEFLDVIDGVTGKRIASLGYRNIIPYLTTDFADGPKHVITFAPENPCAGAMLDRDARVTGLLVDGVQVSFTKPHTVRCSFSELMGVAIVPDFGQMSFGRTGESPQRYLGYFSLPWGRQVTIDLTKVDPAKALTIEE